MNTTPTLEMLDPATLTVDINVRKDAALTPDFIASIAEHGVMEPVIAHRKAVAHLAGDDVLGRDVAEVHLLAVQQAELAYAFAGQLVAHLVDRHQGPVVELHRCLSGRR